MVNSIVNSLLFKPPHNFPYDFPLRIIRLRTARGEEIAAAHLKRRGAHVTVLFSHGNAEDLNSTYLWIKRLSKDLNVNVLSYDYSGYGESTGAPSEENVYADIDACYNYLLEQQKLFPHQIVLYGRSLGSGPSCFLAEKTAKEGQSVAGLILHSPFTSVYRVVLDFGFTMVGDRFPNIDRIQNVQCPVFIVHGKLDEVVPFQHGMSLYEALPLRLRATPMWVDDMSHNNHSVQQGEELMKRLNEYLDYHVLARRLYLLPPSLKPTSSKSRRQRRKSISGTASPTSVCNLR